MLIGDSRTLIPKDHGTLTSAPSQSAVLYSSDSPSVRTLYSNRISSQPTPCSESPRLGRHPSLSASTRSGRERPGIFLPPRSSKYKGKKTLVLDMDETLVHSTLQLVRERHLTISIPMDCSPAGAKSKQKLSMSVMLRPGLEDFMTRACEIFEVIVFTASLSNVSS